MESPQLKFFDIADTSWTYMMMLQPADPAYAYIQSLKKQTDEMLGGDAHQQALPHVTLFQFDMPEEKERRLIRCLQNYYKPLLAMKLPADGVKLYGSNSTVHLSLKGEPKDFALLKDLRQKFFLEMLLPKRKTDVHECKNFHITIAKHVIGTKVQSVLKAMQENEFNEEVTFTQLSLLKRKEAHEKWKFVESFTQM